MSRRAGQRFDADHGVTTEALIFLGELDPEAIGPSLAHATHYEPTPVEAIDELLDAVPIAAASATFVDLGSGMGRVGLVAARRPFRCVVGVEISPALHAVARENLAKWRDPLRRCRDVRFVCRDALDYRFPRGDLVVYLFNPFDSAILEPVVARLREHDSGDVVIVYATPVARLVIEETGAFAIVSERRHGVVYRRREAPSRPPVAAEV